MPTFKRKPEVVDARQFTGEDAADASLLLWIQSNAGEGVRVYIQPLGLRQKKVLSLRYPTNYEVAYLGDWLVWRQHGQFEIVRPEAMELDYEEV
jgi:hypothetical protein